MAEEDDVDVLGDFNLDILEKNDSNMFNNDSQLISENSDLLNCDYTIHPQWLLDKPSTNPALWYSNTSELDQQFELDGQVTEQVYAENSINDESGWTEKEKNLLVRGIEIFGKSNLNLSQFIGSRSPAEVKYYLKNFYSDVQVECNNLAEEVIYGGVYVQETVVDDTQGGDILDSNEIPASMEEVIAAISTAKPTIPITIKHNKHIVHRIQHGTASNRSLLKVNRGKDVSSSVSKVKSAKTVKFKFKVKMDPVPRKKTKKVRRGSTKSETESIKSEASDVQIVTGNGLAVPVYTGEAVVKIRKESESNASDSDVEIDVEDTDDEPKPSDPIVQCSSNTVPDTANKSEIKIQPKKAPQLSDLSKEVAAELMSLKTPSCEVVLVSTEICDVEKFIFHEFFEGRPTKTPDRYLRIRNHILNTWKTCKPSYVTKTSIRNGLKQGGDVNCLGRIHYYLEQIGAINFNCEQTTYSRPLHDMMLITHASREKPVKEAPVPLSKSDSVPRQRIKKKYVNDGEGGYTLTHDEKGSVINTIVVNEEPVVKQRSYVKKPSVRLIYCRPYNYENRQQYAVQLDLSALILMDLHAHMFISEVMGLVAGSWDPENRVLSIKRYEPCRNIASSSTHCDMCPISQAKAAEVLHEEGLEILGWYHSHPTFAPEPSQQDIDTQLSLQQWIGVNKPCVGVILSPFSLHGALIASPYRCLVVQKKENFEDQFVPYKLKVELTTDDLKVTRLMHRAFKILANEGQTFDKNRVDFDSIYYQDNSISYLDKFIYSVKMHLAKCSSVNKMSCDAIVDALTRVCQKAHT